MNKHKGILGAELARKRSLLDRDISDLAEETGLSERFILNLESNNYQELPHDIYALRGLEKYAEALDFDPKYVREQYIQERGKLKRNTSLRREHRYKTPFVTSSILLRLLLLVSVVIIAAYIGYQVIVATSSPQLNVVFPDENQVVHTDEIEIVGMTQPGSMVTIDGRDVNVAEDGSFRYGLTLSEGRHTIRVEAENDLGRSSEVVRNFMIEEGPD